MIMPHPKRYPGLQNNVEVCNFPFLASAFLQKENHSFPYLQTAERFYSYARSSAIICIIADETNIGHRNMRRSAVQGQAGVKTDVGLFGVRLHAQL